LTAEPPVGSWAHVCRRHALNPSRGQNNHAHVTLVAPFADRGAELRTRIIDEGAKYSQQAGD